MTMVRDLLKALIGMFLADAKLTLATLLLVALVAVLVAALRIAPLLAGGLLALGCLAILVEAAGRDAREIGRR